MQRSRVTSPSVYINSTASNTHPNQPRVSEDFGLLLQKMSFVTLSWLTLLLIAQQALSRPADSADNNSTAQTHNQIFSEYTSDVPEDLAARGMGHSVSTITSHNTDAETEESNPVSQSDPATSQGPLEAATTGQNNPETLASSVTSPSSLEPSGSYEIRGFFDKLFGSSAGSQKSNKVGTEIQKPNQIETKAGQQSATVISATTYPEGSKPVTPSKPATGQEKPTGTTGQEKPTAAPTPSAKPPPSQSKPLGSSLIWAILSSLFGFPVTTGSQKPNKPTCSGSWCPFGSSSSGRSATFPGSMAGYMPPPHPPMMFGGLLGSPFGGSGRPSGSDKNENGFVIPPWLASLLRSVETSPDELSTS